jgi:bacterioferritin-associated ferredoxin
VIVCICNGVSDKEIRKYLERGIYSIEEIGKLCYAGTDCGKCVDSIEEIIEDVQPTDQEGK